MSRTSINFGTCTVGSIVSAFLASGVVAFIVVTLLMIDFAAAEPGLQKPIKDLFSHKRHSQVFQGATIECTSCHRFDIKSTSFDPLATNVNAGLSKATTKTCHECHMGKVIAAKVNQCSICHVANDRLAPDSHKLAWKSRHGRFAQMDPESCTSCHQENKNSCANCHTERNILRPKVHRPNFRLTHSIQARSNPASCMTCHTVSDSCAKCHQAGVFR